MPREYKSNSLQHLHNSEPCTALHRCVPWQNIEIENYIEYEIRATNIPECEVHRSKTNGIIGRTQMERLYEPFVVAKVV